MDGETILQQGRSPGEGEGAKGDAVFPEERDEIRIGDFAKAADAAAGAPHVREMFQAGDIGAKDREKQRAARGAGGELSGGAHEEERAVGVKGEAQGGEKGRGEKKGGREKFYRDEEAVALDQECLQGGELAGGRGMDMVDDGGRDIPAGPAREASAKTDVGIVAVGEEKFVKESDLIEHRAAVERGGSIGEENLCGRVVLPAVGLAGASAVIEAVEVDQVAGLVDASAIAMEEDLAGAHAGAGMGIHRGDEFGQPAGVGFGVVVERGDVAAAGDGDAGVAAAGEAAVGGEGDDDKGLRCWRR